MVQVYLSDSYNMWAACQHLLNKLGEALVDRYIEISRKVRFICGK